MVGNTDCHGGLRQGAEHFPTTWLLSRIPSLLFFGSVSSGGDCDSSVMPPQGGGSRWFGFLFFPTLLAVMVDRGGSDIPPNLPMQRLCSYDWWVKYYESLAFGVHIVEAYNIMLNCSSFMVIIQVKCLFSLGTHAKIG
ncbi:hypothetical protein TanjilG_01188 [Lupinus angustifolius]|uniref:Uncharacterized protein n=1 Tax=Lupinus angustifolius TaxID=3871 RepID=A0A1J7HZA5_LUPAN|nr:hypothetical protein TanjilG_01188 [Lupinus angustifolius]